MNPSSVVLLRNSAPTLSEAALQELGIYDISTLRTKANDKRTFLVQDLIQVQSVNLVVGNSGLGKTPLLISLGLAIAAGVPWMNRAASQGSVLYCDAESGQRQFIETVDALARHMGLPEPPPTFFIHSPNWESVGNRPGSLRERVAALRPALVVLDPLRVFYPKAETGTDEAVAMVKELRALSKQFGCAWILLHHRRKANQNPYVSAASLLNDPHGWMQEAAGSHALVNQSDTRLGIDNCEDADLVVTGIVRGRGVATPIYLDRVFDDDGEPKGYVPVEGVRLLKYDERLIYDALPDTFRFKDVKEGCGGGGSKSQRILNRLIGLSLVKKNDSQYTKIPQPDTPLPARKTLASYL